MKFALKTILWGILILSPLPMSDVLWTQPDTQYLARYLNDTGLFWVVYGLYLVIVFLVTKFIRDRLRTRSDDEGINER